MIISDFAIKRPLITVVAMVTLVVFGLFSIATAAVFVVGNNDYRRIFAYTSVEHMGVMVVGVGLGMGGTYASMLHAMHNTLNKGVLFFTGHFGFWELHALVHGLQLQPIGVLARAPAAARESQRHQRDRVHPQPSRDHERERYREQRLTSMDRCAR